MDHHSSLMTDGLVTDRNEWRNVLTQFEARGAAIRRGPHPTSSIISHLSQDTSSDPNENYDKFIEIVLSAKAKHLPTKKKKFNKRKHRIQQDAREAMRVVFFSVRTKRICMHKTKFLMMYSNIVLKIILNCMNLQIATHLTMMYNLEQ